MTGTILYALLILLFLAFAWALHWDRDPGGYVDTFRTRDKIWHACGCFAACLLSIAVLDVPLVGACLLTIAGGAGFELVQRYPRDHADGFFSWRDVVADAVGALLAVLAAIAIGLGS